MAEIKLRVTIEDELERHVAFGGLVKKDTVVLKGNLFAISVDIAEAVIAYIEAASIKQIKDIIKSIID